MRYARYHWPHDPEGYRVLHGYVRRPHHRRKPPRYPRWGWRKRSKQRYWWSNGNVPRKWRRPIEGSYRAQVKEWVRRDPERLPLRGRGARDLNGKAFW